MSKLLSDCFFQDQTHDDFLMVKPFRGLTATYTFGVDGLGVLSLKQGKAPN